MRRARSATQAIGSHFINNEGNINLRISKKDKPNFQQGSRRAYGTAVSGVVIHLVHRLLWPWIPPWIFGVGCIQVGYITQYCSSPESILDFFRGRGTSPNVTLTLNPILNFSRGRGWGTSPDVTPILNSSKEPHKEVSHPLFLVMQLQALCIFHFSLTLAVQCLKCF